MQGPRFFRLPRVLLFLIRLILNVFSSKKLDIFSFLHMHTTDACSITVPNDLAQAPGVQINTCFVELYHGNEFSEDGTPKLDLLMCISTNETSWHGEIFAVGKLVRGFKMSSACGNARTWSPEEYSYALTIGSQVVPMLQTYKYDGRTFIMYIQRGYYILYTTVAHSARKLSSQSSPSLWKTRPTYQKLMRPVLGWQNHTSGP